MPFIPHSQEDIASMLEVIDVKNLEDLFDEIPKELRAENFTKIPEGLTEQEISRLMLERAAQDGVDLNFIGAGAYQHHIPWAVWDIVSRGEIMTSYTPYQAEASQGNLQLIYEYQSMMASLMSLDCSNASLYDGASALAEAVLMAVRCDKNKSLENNLNLNLNGHVLVLGDLSPAYKAVLETLVTHQKIKISYLSGEQVKNLNNLKIWENLNITAVIIPQPSFLGDIQAVDDLVDWARQENSDKKRSLVIGLVNPIAMSLLKPPGEWGNNLNPELNPDLKGVDIACGEGQSLGVPLSLGGPYFGFMCCKKNWVRQMPGRIVGRTVDLDGKEGFCLTLQAREQHIRRAKATSNICTNQGLLMAAGTVYMALMGLNGLSQVAKKCHLNAVSLKNKLENLEGIKIVSQGLFFHEFVIELPECISVSRVIEKMAEQTIQAGFDLGKNQLLICSTEIHTPADHDRYVSALSYILQEVQLARVLSQESVLC